MRRRRAVITTAVAAVVGLSIAACSSDPATPGASSSPPEPTTLRSFPSAAPGDLVGLVADDERRVVAWLTRNSGTVVELAVDDPSAEPVVVAQLAVSVDSQQGGLLGQAVVDGRRHLAWTTPSANELVVGTVDEDGTASIGWSAGAAGDGAIGGTLVGTDDGAIVMTVGRNTAFDAETETGGAVLRFDDAALEAGPDVISVGYTNPWATAVVGDEIWVWDNAAGPDPDDPEVDDVERFGRADLGDRDSFVRSSVTDRAPTAIVELPDGRLGVCGFLDNELRAYDVVDGETGERTLLERAGTIMPCNAGAAVFSDGTIVTLAQTVDGETLQILRP
ncbi:MAG: hypothetical protein AAGG08_01315 [Actinomycetota bacterium]